MSVEHSRRVRDVGGDADSLSSLFGDRCTDGREPFFVDVEEGDPCPSG